ncbi:MAG: alpha-E domain-containing protein [Pirellulaceae bacterium]
MLSRVADSVFISRHIERAENVARFLDVNSSLTMGDGSSLQDQWSPLVFTTGDQSFFDEKYGVANRSNVIQFLAFDQEYDNSIISCVSRARENARTVREVFPVAIWEQLNKFYLMVVAAEKEKDSLTELSEFCDRIKLASSTIIGLIYSTMSHGEPWHFARMGRLLERADKTSRIVDVQYFLLLPRPQDIGSTLDVVRWSALLRSASALEMYRREHGRIMPSRVAEFLLLSRDFPRSAHHCLIAIQDSLLRITGTERGTFQLRSEQLIGRLRSEFDYTSINDIISKGMHQFIDHLQTQLNEIGAAVHDDFFTNPQARTASQQQSQ